MRVDKLLGLSGPDSVCGGYHETWASVTLGSPQMEASSPLADSVHYQRTCMLYLCPVSMKLDTDDNTHLDHDA